MCYKYNMINGIVSAFGPNTVPKWTKDTPLDGDEMQKSLDMLLENDNLMASGIGERHVVEYDEYNQPKKDSYGEVITNEVVNTTWQRFPTYHGEYYGKLQYKTEVDSNLKDIGYSVPPAIKPAGEWYSNGHLCSEWLPNGSSMYMRLFWATTESRWTRIVDVKDKPLASVGQSGNSVPICTYRVPCETGDLDCGENTEGMIQFSGTIEIEMQKYNGDNINGDELLGLSFKYGIDDVRIPFVALYEADSNGKMVVSKTQILNISGTIPANRIGSGREHTMFLVFGQGRGGSVQIGFKATRFMVTYCKGTV